MRGHFVFRSRSQPSMTPEKEELAKKLIGEGMSTTKLFRALGYRNSNTILKWLEDKPELKAKLTENAKVYKASMATKWASKSHWRM